MSTFFIFVTNTQKMNEDDEDEMCFVLCFIIFIFFINGCMVFFIIHYCVQKWPFHRGIRRASGSPPRGTNDDSNVTAAPTIQVGGKLFLKIKKKNKKKN